MKRSVSEIELIKQDYKNLHRILENMINTV